MTVTVEAGVTMQALAETLAAERQRLPIDVPLAERATVGGVVATNWNGPRRYGQGTVRDYVIGITAIDGRGMMFKGGGRVVKNVAGYDFCKLLTGSLGTLGVITQVTFKLKPLPELSALLACCVPDPNVAEARAGGAGRERDDADGGRTAGRAGLGGRAVAPRAGRGVARLPVPGGRTGRDGPRGRVHDPPALGRVAAVGGRRAAGRRRSRRRSGGGWSSFRPRQVAPGAEGQRGSQRRDRDGRGGPPARSAAVRSRPMPRSGTVLIKLAKFPEQGLSRALVGQLQPAAAAHRGNLIVLSNPSGAEMTHQSVWGAIDVPLDLMTEVKRKFDPKDILNRGRFVYV